MSKEIFHGKKILFGVTGCIAAYKSALLVRELVKNGAEIRVVMTPSAAEFIAPLTFSALSRNEVIVNMFPSDRKGNTALSTNHIDNAVWADLMMIAPATVNTAAKIAHGFADNALTTLVSALRCPLLLAPAADVDMYKNPLTRQNLEKLEELGHYIIHAEEGILASGLSGKGRLAGIDKIMDAAELVLSGYKKDFTNKNILVTAGPTFEDIDPVRFIGNRSSGKMGFALAKASYLRGANVTLITGQTSEISYPEINLVKIRSAAEMKKAVEKDIVNNDVLIMSAAVADYKPSALNKSKIKKEDKLSSVQLTETEDILASLDKKNKFVVGFALETDNELQNARKKLKNKNLDMIVLNSLKDRDSGFEVDTNKITIINKTNKKITLPLLSKFQAANKILSEINKIIDK